MNLANPELQVPREQQPSGLRRLFRRTLYLRLLDGQFILWCYETGSLTRQESDLLAHPRVVVSDPQAFLPLLQRAARAVGVRRLFPPQRILLLHCLRQLTGDLTPLEKQALVEISKRLGVTEFFLLPTSPREMRDEEIPGLCQEVGALRRRVRVAPAG